MTIPWCGAHSTQYTVYMLWVFDMVYTLTSSYTGVTAKYVALAWCVLHTTSVNSTLYRGAWAYNHTFGFGVQYIYCWVCGHTQGVEPSMQCTLHLGFDLAPC